MCNLQMGSSATGQGDQQILSVLKDLGFCDEGRIDRPIQELSGGLKSACAYHKASLPLLTELLRTHVILN